MINSTYKLKNMQLMVLWSYLSKRRKKQFGLLLTLMILASFSEVISIGALLPFLGILTAPEQIYQSDILQPLVKLLEITRPNQLILPLTFIFITAIMVVGVIRLLLLFVMTRLSYATGADLSISIYRRTLYQEYLIHIGRNSSEIINGIISKTVSVIVTIQSLLTLISSIILLIGIIVALLVISTKIAIVALAGFGVLYFGVIRYTHKQLKENSEIIADQSTRMIKSLQEGLGGIRDVLIDSSQEFYCKLYQNADLSLRRASGNNVFISNSPRYIIEAIGMSLIAGFAYIISKQDGGLTTAIPILGALALGAQRLLPALQQAYGSYSTIKGAKSSLDDVLRLLEQPLPDYAEESLLAPIPFKKTIQLNNVNFNYAVDGTKTESYIIKNINLKLTKGESIGFIGETGSGKSTLLDIIMGLLPPTDGNLLVDGQCVTIENRRAWQAHIAHVPQNIYLSDNTIEENIAFGVPKEEIDHKKVENAAKKAQILKLIEGWQDGYQTFVGERGVRLSGGQRQRIGIARALYKQADVLVLDEATSALDSETEQAVMDSIEGLEEELTILIIAHRLTTLKGCDRIVSLRKNGNMEIVSYDEIHI